MISFFIVCGLFLVLLWSFHLLYLSHFLFFVLFPSFFLLVCHAPSNAFNPVVSLCSMCLPVPFLELLIWFWIDTLLLTLSCLLISEFAFFKKSLNRPHLAWHVCVQTLIPSFPGTNMTGVGPWKCSLMITMQVTRFSVSLQPPEVVQKHCWFAKHSEEIYAIQSKKVDC